MTATDLREPPSPEGEGAGVRRTPVFGEGRILLEIPRDPRSGATTLVLDPLEWVRRITNQVPAPKAHMVR